jgi:hypothetical protein
VTVHEPTGPAQTNDQAADAALTNLHRRLYDAAQRDREGKTDLLRYLNGRRITDLDMAETTEQLLILNDRSVTPDAAPAVSS